MSQLKEPEMIDDGLLMCKNVSVYVCDADDRQEGGYDVHLNVGDGNDWNVMFDSSDTLCNRSTLREAWEDAREWLEDHAATMLKMAGYINTHDELFDDEEEDANERA